MSRLKEMYSNEIKDAMVKKFGYKNVMQIPKLEKIVINMGVGEAKENAKVLRNESRVIVEGVNIVKQHVKPNRTNETGGILEIEAPIHISNVFVLSEEKKENKKSKKESK